MASTSNCQCSHNLGSTPHINLHQKTTEEQLGNRFGSILYEAISHKYSTRRRKALRHCNQFTKPDILVSSMTLNLNETDTPAKLSGMISRTFWKAGTNAMIIDA